MTSLCNLRIAKIELKIELLLWDYSELFEFQGLKAAVPLLIIMENCLYSNLSGEECHRLTYTKSSGLTFTRDLASNQCGIICLRFE